MWLDRISGEKLEALPENIEVSRYVATQDIQFNGHSTVCCGDLLVDDGSGHFLEGINTLSFLQPELDGTVLVESDIVNSVLMEFKAANNEGRQASFLLPEKLLAWLHLQPFDLIIQDVIEKGHFHEIARAPKMDLVYEEHLLPVSRVKRIPSSATRHLASHSECWQKRSFSGVVPKSILALESEDEYNIYENKVFARLIDHLERYLQRRCREVSCIEETIKKREEFDGADIYWGVRDSICSLWGEGFDTNAQVQDEAIEGLGTLQILRSLLRQVRGLRESRLYKAVPQKDDVGLKIRMTNTLAHDQHYRHVARLWHQWVDNSKSGRVNAEAQLAQNMAISEAYFEYVYALAFRALEELGYRKEEGQFVIPHGNTIDVSTKNFNIVLTVGGKTLTIAPLYGCLENSGKAINYNASQLTIVITPEMLDFKVDSSDQTASPLYFYTLEAMVARLSSWLALQTTSVMDVKLEKLPLTVLAVLGSKYKEYFDIAQGGAYLKLPLGDQLSKIKSEFGQSKQDVSLSRFLLQLEEYSLSMDALMNCPICGKAAISQDFFLRDARSFEIKSSSCDHVWKIDRDSASNRLLIAEPRGEAGFQLDYATTFRHFGRYKWLVTFPS